MRCQNSPQYASLRYGNSEKKLPTDYANENGLLYYLSSTIIFWKTDYECCKSVRMIPNEHNSPNIQGSLSLLWPLFLSFCLNQFVETLSCSVESRQPMPEAGMTIFEHSLAFAEAETMVSKGVGLGLFGVPSTSSFSDEEKAIGKGLGITSMLTRSMILRRLNVPSEVLIIALISALSHFSSSILAVLGIRARYRFFSTGIWALLYMLAFLWSISRIILNSVPEDVNILRFPTVCIVGFVPHLLILIGICVCASIYFLALLITAVSHPPGTGSITSFAERIKLAYSNLQANVHLSASTPLSFDRRDDFYTTILKVGITILTTASEAVFMKESIVVRANDHTWLEEKRAEEIANTLAKIRAVNEHRTARFMKAYDFKNLTQWDKTRIETNKPHLFCGYARERKMNNAGHVQDISYFAESESGVGLRQRRGVWIATFEFAKAIVFLWGKLIAKCIFAISRGLRIRFGSSLLSSLSNNPEPRNSSEKSLGNPDYVYCTAEREGISSPFSHENIDVENETRKILLKRSPLLVSDEASVSRNLYNWWKAGGWWGEADSSGEFEPSETEDDATSNSSCEKSANEADDTDNGSLTPKRPVDCRSDRSVSEGPDSILDVQDLALLLDPKSTEQQEEARLLASHLRSERTLTRAQYRLSQIREKSSVLTSSKYFSAGRTNGGLLNLSFEEKQDLLLETFILERRQRKQQLPPEDETRNWTAGNSGMGSNTPLCVVCQQNPRNVLIWPCGCLSLCDDCRLGLAARNYSNCVCCRSDVTAYSRLYVP